MSDELVDRVSNITITQEHKFWDTQPVPKLNSQIVSENCPIETKKVGDVRPDPYNLPDGFEWCVLDVNSDVEENEIYNLLNENYVEDDEHLFRFDYSRAFLNWALTPPGYFQDWHLGVRATKSKKLLGFISGVPAIMRIHGTDVKTAEINFLCVHKKLRSKRLAPVLIKEVTRRINLHDVWQAVYTAGVVLPSPISRCRYFHRSLNPAKLINIGFSRLPHRMTLARLIKLYRLPQSPAYDFQPMSEDDVPSAYALVKEYLLKFKLHPMMNIEHFKHWLMPRNGVVSSFVKKNEQGAVTDFCSFYLLPSTIIGHPRYSTLFAAYSFYNVATTIPLKALMKDALTLASAAGMDVFNALNLMDNEEFLKELMFGIGDGHLQYYLYNWSCPVIAPAETGLVLL